MQNFGIDFMFALCDGAQDLVFVWAGVKPTKSIRFHLCKGMFMLCGAVSLAKYQLHTNDAYLRVSRKYNIPADECIDALI